MIKFYLFWQLVVCCFLLPVNLKSQDCSTLTATCTSYESRCAATGSIKVVASGGSGNYKYRTIGPVNLNYTTSDSLTGLSAGTYTVLVNDLVTNCTFAKINVIVAGTYNDPRFTLERVDVSCNDASNGSISVTDLQFGRAPFQYTIITPSTSNIGTTNTSGNFPGLPGGQYFVQLTDSCGGIQTRQVIINNYSWWIDDYSFIKKGCDSASGYIKVVDSRGNISTQAGIPGFTYGIVRSAGDTIWSTSAVFSFPLAGHNFFNVIAKDACGIIKKAFITIFTTPIVGATVSTYDYLCNSFTAELNNVINFINGTYCLYNNSNVMLTCNATAKFPNLAYGSYCIKAHDSCTDTTIIRCFSVAPPPISIGNSVIQSNKSCTNFTATITGQFGLTNPTYCLFNAADSQLVCNSSGIFNNLPYGRYCIKTTDGCRDTTITRCFTVLRPIPQLSEIVPSYLTCRRFGIVVDGDSLYMPEYCLYDSNAVLISCNETGIFDSIPLGRYCVSVYDSCYDTTITRCITVTPPVLTNQILHTITDRSCATFNLLVSSNNMVNPEYCLYDAMNVLIACDSSGTFVNIPYGSYCIKAKNTCPDTTMITCFTVSMDIPSVNGSVTFTNLACSTFEAAITGMANLNNPQYCLYNTADSLLQCNTSGTFPNLAYGSYCIKIVNSCYDTTITRCFSKFPVPGNITGTTSPSCAYRYARFQLSIANIYPPVTIRVFNPNGSILRETTFNTNPIILDSLPGLSLNETYKILAYDNCNNRDSVNLAASASSFTHSASVKGKCPGGAWANGSANIETTVSTNLGSLTVRIISKDGTLSSPLIQPNSITGNLYSFQDLGPGTYIIRYSESACSLNFYDTIVVSPYQYPNLSRSSAYQCDVNGFSVSAIASNGVGPFSYEIIGSVPSTPVIITGPQTSPIFNINNGAMYSLIRLRALDACGNATLGDASILPLAVNGITATQNCFQAPTTLTVDSIFNSTYTWYKRLNLADSIFIGMGTSYHLPDLLPTDTGWYVCHVTVNSGCINKTYLYHLDASCSAVLPLKLDEFNGMIVSNGHALKWKTSLEKNLKKFIIERKGSGSSFVEIGSVSPFANTTTISHYEFIDRKPLPGKNFYRLRMIGVDNSVNHSNTITLSHDNAKNTFTVFPNPVRDMLVIECNAKGNHRYKLSLLNSLKQVIHEINFNGSAGSIIQLPRPEGTRTGIYILRITDLDVKEEYKEKLMFL